MVSAREFTHEWLDTFNHLQESRTKDGRTSLPRTPVDLADWLDHLPTHSAPWLLVPASRG